MSDEELEAIRQKALHQHKANTRTVIGELVRECQAERSLLREIVEAWESGSAFRTNDAMHAARTRVAELHQEAS